MGGVEADDETVTDPKDVESKVAAMAKRIADRAAARLRRTHSKVLCAFAELLSAIDMQNAQCTEAETKDLILIKESELRVSATAKNVLAAELERRGATCDDEKPRGAGEQEEEEEEEEEEVKDSADSDLDAAVNAANEL